MHKHTCVCAIQLITMTAFNTKPGIFCYSKSLQELRSRGFNLRTRSAFSRYNERNPADVAIRSSVNNTLQAATSTVHRSNGCSA